MAAKMSAAGERFIALYRQNKDFKKSLFLSGMSRSGAYRLKRIEDLRQHSKVVETLP